MKQIKITLELARSAGQDAGNRNMKKAGRSQWNEDDWNVATKRMNTLLNFTEEEE